jgi:hypothetical protein
MSDYTNYKQGGSEPVSGDIVQMAVGEYTQSGHLKTNSTSKASGVIQVSITPRFSDSTIRIRFISNMAYGRSGGRLMCSLYRMESGGTSGYVVYDTRSGENKYGWTYNNQDAWGGDSAIWYDQPNTTNQLTYVPYFNVYTGGQSDSYFLHYNMPAFLQLSEIKA